MRYHNFHIELSNIYIQFELPPSRTKYHFACKNPYAIALYRIHSTLHIMFDVNPFEIVKFKNTICRTCDSKNIKLKITIGKITLCFRCSCELLTYCVLGIVLYSVFFVCVCGMVTGCRMCFYVRTRAHIYRNNWCERQQKQQQSIYEWVSI